MKARIKYLSLFAAAALALSGCSGGGASPDGGNAPLPDPPSAQERQILGDTAVGGAREVTLYRASDGALELTAVTRSIAPGADGSLIRAALEQLLDASYDGEPMPVGGAQATLMDVEFGGGVATVRLGIDAVANRGDQDYLLLCASVANTLLGIDGVEAVNVLAGSRSEAVCGLPTGMFGAQNLNVSAAYAQLQSEQERFLRDGAMALERTACLYFPAYGGQYLLPEARKFTFRDQNYASALIEALQEGPLARACCFSAIPGNLELLEGEPELYVTPDGERVLDLKLSPVLVNYLALANVESWQLYGSLVLTLTSFVPELDAVRILLGDQCVTECDLGTQLATFPDGRMRRSDFASLVGGSAQLYFLSGDGGLVRLECAISQAGAVSARSVISAMITLGDSYLPELRSAFPAGVGPEDVLGVAVEDRVATVNLSGNFYSQCQGLDSAGERALVYAMVNALTELDAVGAVRFLVEGREVDSLVGGVYLRTALMPDPGAVRDYAPAAAQEPTEGEAP